MRYFLISAILAVISIAGLSCEKREKLQVTSLGHTNSKAVLNTVFVVHNRKKAQLKMYNYYKYDETGRKTNEVAILHDEDARPWLLFKTVFNTTDSQVILYEYRDNRWDYVITLQNLSDDEVAESISDLVKDRYGLKFLSNIFDRFNARKVR